MSIEAMKQMVEAIDADLKLFNIPATAKMLEALNAGRQSIAEAEKQEPVAYIRNDGQSEELIWSFEKDDDLDEFYKYEPLHTHPQPKRERVVFPTVLRKMWSGGEVQAWIDENVNKENT